MVKHLFTTFTPYHTFRIATGIGPYNVSYGQDSDPSFVTALFTSRFSDLFEDLTTAYPLAPTACTSDDCSSYLFPGGFEDMDPDPGLITNYTEADVLVVQKSSGIQIQYSGLGADDQLGARDCRTFGNDYAALMICIASSYNSDSLIASSSILIFG